MTAHVGEPAGIRTQDTRLKRPMLYQLSYGLIQCYAPLQGFFRTIPSPRRLEVETIPIGQETNSEIRSR